MFDSIAQYPCDDQATYTALQIYYQVDDIVINPFSTLPVNLTGRPCFSHSPESQLSVSEISLSISQFLTEIWPFKDFIIV